jgi:hypothetical protein
MKNLLDLLHQNISCEDSMLMVKLKECVRDGFIDQMNADVFVKIFQNMHMDRKVSCFINT